MFARLNKASTTTRYLDSCRLLSFGLSPDGHDTAKLIGRSPSAFPGPIRAKLESCSRHVSCYALDVQMLHSKPFYSHVTSQHTVPYEVVGGSPRQNEHHRSLRERNDTFYATVETPVFRGSQGGPNW